MVQESMQQHSPFDVVFMDAQMTEIHGPEAAAAMRAMGFRGMVVAVSGNVVEEDVQHFKKCGADAFISKPLELEKVEKVMAGMEAVLCCV